MSRGVVHRHGSDLALLWLWHRLAATALIRPLAWEPPYAADATLKKKRQQQKIPKSAMRKQQFQDSRIRFSWLSKVGEDPHPSSR